MINSPDRTIHKPQAREHQMRDSIISSKNGLCDFIETEFFFIYSQINQSFTLNDLISLCQYGISRMHFVE